MNDPINNNIPVELFPDDVFLVSYPKSGRTWMRFLVSNYLTDNTCDFLNSYLRVPGIDYNPEQCIQIERPRIIQSHWSFTPDFKRVVYIVRDGRDVVVSYYFHMMKFRVIDQATSFKDFVLNFNHGHWDKSVSWSSHVNMWLDNAPDDFLIVKYEELKSNTNKELMRILNFVGLPVQIDKVEAAVKASTFERMKSLESSGNLYEELAKTDLSIPHIRRGKIGGYTEYFDDELLTEFIKVHGSALKRLGYLQNETHEVATELTSKPFYSEIEPEKFQPIHQLQTEALNTNLNESKAEFSLPWEMFNEENKGKSDLYSMIDSNLSNIKILLNAAEFNSQIPNKFPERLNRFPFNLSRGLQELALKLHGFLFKKQRAVNMALIQALKESLEVNQKLVEQVTDLQLQLSQSGKNNIAKEKGKSVR